MKRNLGIDLLRMILMLMVLVLHILGSGGILETAQPLSANYSTAWLLETMAYCAVDCYVIITGYVYAGRKAKLSSYVFLWLQVAVYSLGIATCAWLLNPESFAIRKIFYFLTPVSHNLFWFFSAYTGLFVLIPILNSVVQALSRSRAKRYLCAIIIVLSGISIFSFSDPFAMNHGYSVLWFIVLYMIGACIKQFNWETRIKRKHAFFIYLLCVLVSWGVKIGGEWIAQMLGMPTPPTGLLISYISPTILLSAIALFLIFCNLDLSKPLGKFVSVFSPTAFSVYIIHCHECIGVHLIRKKYTFLADKNPILMIGCVIGFALAIFIICLLIDWVRMRIFGALKIKQHLIKVEDKIQSFFCSRMM